MKPGKNDKYISVKIEGAQLVELQKYAWQMAEAFGMDKKIADYKGTRPIKLYRWDIECLLDTISMALEDKQEYPSENEVTYIALNMLFQRLKSLYENTYGETYY